MMELIEIRLIKIHFRTAMTVRCLPWISATNQSPATLRAMIPDIAMIFCLRYLVFVVFWQPPTMHHWRNVVGGYSHYVSFHRSGNNSTKSAIFHCRCYIIK